MVFAQYYSVMFKRTSLPFSTWSYSEIFALITRKSIPNTVRMIIVITVLQILLVIVEYLNN